jgi:hypothetical protein
MYNFARSSQFNASPILTTILTVQHNSHPYSDPDSSTHLPSWQQSWQFNTSPTLITILTVQHISHPYNDPDSSTHLLSSQSQSQSQSQSSSLTYLNVIHWPLLSSIQSLPRSFPITILYAYLVISGLSLLIQLYSFFNLYTADRTLWTGDQPIARPLPTHKQRQAHTAIHSPNGTWTHDHSVRAG